MNTGAIIGIIYLTLVILYIVLVYRDEEKFYKIK